MISINLTDRQADLLFHLLDIHEASSSNQADRDLAYEVRRQITEEGVSDCPSYTCPKCRRGVMQCATNHGDGWASMECPDCGHTEQAEVDQ